MKTICVITPTISRPTLRRAITSARLTERDEWLVIGDGPQPQAERVVSELFVLPYLRYIEGPRTGHRGNEQRDLGMAQAESDYFLFLDDDDIFERGAIDIVRRHIDVLPQPQPIMFRMHHNGAVRWGSRRMDPGNVGGSMFCCPNIPGRLGRWAGHNNEQTSDMGFIVGTLAHYRGVDQMIWSGDVIVRANP